jgi:hypothetical protein
VDFFVLFKVLFVRQLCAALLALEGLAQWQSIDYLTDKDINRLTSYITFYHVNLSIRDT